eukprot:6454017-Alexandrium_andersonii.AAC.1
MRGRASHDMSIASSGRKCPSAGIRNRFRQARPCPKLLEAASGSLERFRAASGALKQFRAALGQCLGGPQA